MHDLLKKLKKTQSEDAPQLKERRNDAWRNIKWHRYQKIKKALVTALGSEPVVYVPGALVPFLVRYLVSDTDPEALWAASVRSDSHGLQKMSFVYQEETESMDTEDGN